MGEGDIECELTSNHLLEKERQDWFVQPNLEENSNKMIGKEWNC